MSHDPVVVLAWPTVTPAAAPKPRSLGRCQRRSSATATVAVALLGCAAAALPWQCRGPRQRPRPGPLRRRRSLLRVNRPCLSLDSDWFHSTAIGFLGPALRANAALAARLAATAPGVAAQAGVYSCGY